MRGRFFVPTVVLMSVAALIASAMVPLPGYVQRVRIYNQDLVIANGGMSPPQLLTYVTPAYTSAASESGVKGVVSFLAEFDIYGNFRILRLLDGLGFGLDESALAAVNQWRFRPAFRSGRRVGVVSQIDVVFDPQEQLRIIQQLVDRFSRAGLKIRIETSEGAIIAEGLNLDFDGERTAVEGSIIDVRPNLDFEGGRTTVPGTIPQMKISAEL